MENLVIVGTSTTAKTIMSFVEHYSLFNIIGFAVNRSYIKDSVYCGKPIYAIEELDKIIDKNKVYLFVAIQWNHLNADRRRVYEALKEEGYKFANLISPSAIIKGKIAGDNCWIADQVNIDFGTTIGNNCFIKINAFVADGCIIGDHCFIGAKSLIAGGCKVGKQSFIGLSSTIFDDTDVGEKCIVGACTVVKRNLPNFTKISTTLESYKIKQYSEDIIESKLVSSLNVR